MSDKIVFMFSGQGSHHFQMARALFEQERVFRDSMTRLDGIVRDLAGSSVLEALYSPANPKGATFDRIQLTHPAIFMVEYSLAQSLMRAGVEPDITLGASLGSFAAAAVSGFITAEDALAAVIRQASVMDECCTPGGMYAVLSNPALYAQPFLSANSAMAGVNFSSHFVVSARRAQFASIEAGLRANAVAFQRLPVSFAFHSEWIEEARGPFESFTRTLRLKPGELPFVSCHDAAPAAELADGFFWRVVREPIRFRDAITRLEGSGAYRYIDVGPASTLATFLKYALPAGTRSTVLPILSPYGHDQKNLAAVMAATRH
jgi:bacillaene synthase trans-acting acyltransferase